MRSLVCCGIESATADRFITSDTVAGERPSSSASSFKLTRAPGFPPRRELFDAVFFFADTMRSIAKADCKRQAEGRKIGRILIPKPTSVSAKPRGTDPKSQATALAFQASDSPAKARQMHQPPG